MSLNYDTNALTAKNGSVWTLKFTTTYNSTVTFPQFSTLLAASGTPYSTPYSINDTNSTPELYVAPGTWTVSYAVPLGSITTSTESPQEGGVPGLTLVQSEELALAAVAVAGAGFYFLWWRRRRLGPVSRDLRPDDVQVLNFIQEKGGKALELEIRTRFALPKTSAWRQIKRLERLGYVKVTKVGSQNQIEIQKREKAEP